MSKLKKRFSASNHQTRDPMGKAIQLYWHGINTNQQMRYTILVEADLIEDDVIPVEYLFRTRAQMPKTEQLALDTCEGRVLDVGAAAGCHSLELQSRGLDVLAIDTSYGAVEVLKDRGIPVKKVDFYEMQPAQNGQFDRILLLMNGLGIAGAIENLSGFFQKLDSLLAENGEVLLDSSDFDADAEAFSEINYQIKFLNQKSKWFSWLYLPYQKLSEHAFAHGFLSDLIFQDDGGAYLARLRRK